MAHDSATVDPRAEPAWCCGDHGTGRNHVEDGTHVSVRHEVTAMDGGAVAVGLTAHATTDPAYWADPLSTRIVLAAPGGETDLSLTDAERLGHALLDLVEAAEPERSLSPLRAP